MATFEWDDETDVVSRPSDDNNVKTEGAVSVLSRVRFIGDLFGTVIDPTQWDVISGALSEVSNKWVLGPFGWYIKHLQLSYVIETDSFSPQIEYIAVADGIGGTPIFGLGTNGESVLGTGSPLDELSFILFQGWGGLELWCFVSLNGSGLIIFQDTLTNLGIPFNSPFYDPFKLQLEVTPTNVNFRVDNGGGFVTVASSSLAGSAGTSIQLLFQEPNDDAGTAPEADNFIQNSGKRWPTVTEDVFVEKDLGAPTAVDSSDFTIPFTGNVKIAYKFADTPGGGAFSAYMTIPAFLALGSLGTHRYFQFKARYNDGGEFTDAQLDEIVLSTGVTVTITGVDENTGRNTEPKTVTITGTGFAGGMTTRLVRSGENDIDGEALSVEDSETLVCTFPIEHAKKGKWDVVITVDSVDYTLPEAFTVLEPILSATKLSRFGKVEKPVTPSSEPRIVGRLTVSGPRADEDS